MAPSAGVSVRWDQLYGRSLQCDFLPFGARDLISGCSWWSRCLAGGKGGGSGAVGPEQGCGHDSQLLPQIQACGGRGHAVSLRSRRRAVGARAAMQGRAILPAPLQGCEHKSCPDSTTDKPGVEHVIL